MSGWLALYLIGAGISWVLCYGMLLADLQHIYPDYRWRNRCEAMVISTIGSALWPWGLLKTWDVTEGAKHGLKFR